MSEQIKYKIASGDLAPGSRLPPASELAVDLQVNRNTVLSTYRELARGGFVELRSGVGTFVASDIHRLRHTPEHLAFLKELDESVSSAIESGLSPESVANLALAHARINAAGLSGRTSRPVVLALFECNERTMANYESELSKSLDVEIRTFLIPQLDTGTAPAGLAESDLAVTSFFHMAEVRGKLRRIKDVTNLECVPVAVAVRPNPRVIRDLASLPSKSAIAFLHFESPHFTDERLQAIVNHLRQSNLNNLARIEPVLVPDDVSAEDVDGFDALLVRPEDLAKNPHVLKLGRPIIEYLHVIDDASLDLIRDVVDDARRAKVGANESRIPWGEPVRAVGGKHG